MTNESDQAQKTLLDSLPKEYRDRIVSELADKPRRRFCYHMPLPQSNPNGYVPAVVFEGESGFYPLVGRDELSEPWYWGKTEEEARRITAKANAELGHTVEDVKDIMDSSIIASIRESGKADAARGRFEGKQTPG